LDEEVAQDGVGTAVSEVEQADLQWAGAGKLDLASAGKSRCTHRTEVLHVAQFQIF
jgi:hypothetical protein